MAAKKKGGGGSLTRSQVVAVRLDPKLHYLTGLAALKHRRTLSSYIEWAVQESLKNVYLATEPEYNDRLYSLHEEGDGLWDVDPPDRFAKLALRYPELLTHTEQIKWKLIRENGYLWKGRSVNGEWTWTVEGEYLIIERLRKYWEKFCEVSEGDADASVLPRWNVKEGIELPEPKSFEDEIPF
ncbi:MAG: hypothetical protein PHR86_03900 [Desulfobacterales bacterium]|jgi:hypothetical protein|nr:hypothetical protein [Desulfobacterales bacterium]